MRLGINITTAMMKMIIATVMMFARLIFCLFSRRSKQLSCVLILAPQQPCKKVWANCCYKNHTVIQACITSWLSGQLGKIFNNGSLCYMDYCSKIQFANTTDMEFCTIFNRWLEADVLLFYFPQSLKHPVPYYAWHMFAVCYICVSQENKGNFHPLCGIRWTAMFCGVASCRCWWYVHKNHLELRAELFWCTCVKLWDVLTAVRKGNNFMHLICVV